MKWRIVHIIVLLLCCGTLFAQRAPVGVRKRTPKQVETEGKIARRMQDLNERAHDRLTAGMSMSPRQYEDTIRAHVR